MFKVQYLFRTKESSSYLKTKFQNERVLGFNGNEQYNELFYSQERTSHKELFYSRLSWRSPLSPRACWRYASSRTQVPWTSFRREDSGTYLGPAPPCWLSQSPPLPAVVDCHVNSGREKGIDFQKGSETLLIRDFKTTKHSHAFLDSRGEHISYYSWNCHAYLCLGF